MSVRITYGDQPHTLEIAATTTAPQTSVSGRYLSVHLPRSESPAKTVIATDDQPMHITILHDLDEGGASVECLITAGNSAYAVAVTATLDGRFAIAHGVTGATIAVTVTP